MSASAILAEDLKQLRYVILPGKLPHGSPHIELHNRAFNYWSSFWDEVFRQNGVEKPIHFREEFCRRDVVCLLLDGDEIVGMHLCEFLNMRQWAFRHHEYFQQVKGELFLHAAEAHQIDGALIMTYLTVDPQWRKRRIGVSLGAVLMSLATKLQVAAGMDVNLGRAREDLGVSDILLDLGGTVLEKGISMHNTPISNICIFSKDVRELSNPTERALASLWWKNRNDLSGLTAERQSTLSLAA